MTVRRSRFERLTWTTLFIAVLGALGVACGRDQRIDDPGEAQGGSAGEPPLQGDASGPGVRAPQFEVLREHHVPLFRTRPPGGACGLQVGSSLLVFSGWNGGAAISKTELPVDATETSQLLRHVTWGTGKGEDEVVVLGCQMFPWEDGALVLVNAKNEKPFGEVLLIDAEGEVVERGSLEGWGDSDGQWAFATGGGRLTAVKTAAGNLTVFDSLGLWGGSTADGVELACDTRGAVPDVVVRHGGWAVAALCLEGDEESPTGAVRVWFYHEGKLITHEVQLSHIDAKGEGWDDPQLGHGRPVALLSQKDTDAEDADSIERVLLAYRSFQGAVPDNVQLAQVDRREGIEPTVTAYGGLSSLSLKYASDGSVLLTSVGEVRNLRSLVPASYVCVLEDDLQSAEPNDCFSPGPFDVVLENGDLVELQHGLHETHVRQLSRDSGWGDYRRLFDVGEELPFGIICEKSSCRVVSRAKTWLQEERVVSPGALTQLGFYQVDGLQQAEVSIEHQVPHLVEWQSGGDGVFSSSDPVIEMDARGRVAFVDTLSQPPSFLMLGPNENEFVLTSDLFARVTHGPIFLSQDRVRLFGDRDGRPFGLEVVGDGAQVVRDLTGIEPFSNVRGARLEPCGTRLLYFGSHLALSDDLRGTDFQRLGAPDEAPSGGIFAACSSTHLLLRYNEKPYLGVIELDTGAWVPVAEQRPEGRLQDVAVAGNRFAVFYLEGDVPAPRIVIIDGDGASQSVQLSAPEIGFPYDVNGPHLHRFVVPHTLDPSFGVVALGWTDNRGRRFCRAGKWARFEQSGAFSRLLRVHGWNRTWTRVARYIIPPPKVGPRATPTPENVKLR